MPEDFVRVENLAGPVAEVWLSRPAKKNALTIEMLDRLVDVARRLAGQAGLRAVLLAGEGGDFSAGMDIDVLKAAAGNLDALRADLLTPCADGGGNRFQKPTLVWLDLPVPVIAALEGVCYGAAAQIALAADFRIARPDSRFSIMEGKWGLVPDMGVSLTLPRLIPSDRAKDLIMTARVLNGSEAYQMGLVTRLSDDPVAEARHLASALAARSPDAVRAAKTLVNRACVDDPGDLLRLEAELQSDLIGAPNQIEAVMANLQRRSPSFR